MRPPIPPPPLLDPWPELAWPDDWPPWLCFPPPSSDPASWPTRLPEPPEPPLLPPCDCFPPPRSEPANCPTKLPPPEPPWPLCFLPPRSAFTAKPCPPSARDLGRGGIRATYSQPACAVARGPVDASCSVADIRALRAVCGLVVRIGALGRGAGVRITADRSLAGGELPLRHAGADLHVCVPSQLAGRARVVDTHSSTCETCLPRLAWRRGARRAMAGQRRRDPPPRRRRGRRSRHARVVPLGYPA